MAKDTDRKNPGFQDESILDPSNITDSSVLEARRAFPVPITILECITDPNLKLRILNENLIRVQAQKEIQRMYDADNRLLFSEKDSEKINLLITEKIKQIKEKEQALIQQNELTAAQIEKASHEILQQIMNAEPEQAALAAEIIQLQSNIERYRKQIDVLQSQINDLHENARITIQSKIDDDPIFNDFDSNQKDEIYEIIKQSYFDAINKVANPDAIYKNSTPNNTLISSIAFNRHTQNANQTRVIEDAARIAHIRVDKQILRCGIPAQDSNSLDSGLKEAIATYHSFQKAINFLEDEITEKENKIIIAQEIIDGKKDKIVEKPQRPKMRSFLDSLGAVDNWLTTCPLRAAA